MYKVNPLTARGNNYSVVIEHLGLGWWWWGGGGAGGGGHVFIAAANNLSVLISTKGYNQPSKDVIIINTAAETRIAYSHSYLACE